MNKFVIYYDFMILTKIRFIHTLQIQKFNQRDQVSLIVSYRTRIVYSIEERVSTYRNHKLTHIFM